MRVPAGDTCRVLLAAVERLLLALAGTGPRPGCPDTSLVPIAPPGRPPPAPLAGRAALAALYRLSDGLDHQLRHSCLRSADHHGVPGSAARTVRLPAADLEILHTAAVAFTSPSAELASQLSRVDPTGAGAAVLIALLGTLIPLENALGPQP